jgi:hypothetical protein
MGNSFDFAEYIRELTGGQADDNTRVVVYAKDYFEKLGAILPQYSDE